MKNSTGGPDILQESLRYSIVAGALGIFFFMIVQTGPIPLMLEKLGAGGVAIGLTVTLFQLGMLSQIPAAFLAERLSRRKPFWVWTTIIARLLPAIPGIYLLLLPDHSSSIVVLTLVAIGLFSFLAQASTPAWFSWIADLLPESMSASYWSKRVGVLMIAAVISVAFTGWFLDLFPAESIAGFGWLLIFASVMGMLDIAVQNRVFEPPVTPVNRSLAPRERILRPLKNRDFLYATAAMCVWFFGIGFFGPFLNIYLKNEFGISYTHISSIQLASMISGVVASFFSGRLIERLGLRTFGLAMVMMVPAASVPWFFLNGEGTGLLPILGVVPQPVMVLCIQSLVFGGVYASVGILQVNLLSALAPSEGRTMAMAVHWSLVGTLSALGPLTGGWIKDYFSAHPLDLHLYSGTPLSFFHILLILHAVLILFVMLPLLMRIAKKDGEWPLPDAVADIFIFTPLRSVRNAYNYNLAAGLIAVKTAKGTVSAAGGIAARAIKDTGTIAARAIKDTATAASHAGKESVEEVKRKQESRKSKSGTNRQDD